MLQRRKTEMARNIDVFGFDELEKAMKQCEKNYPSQADAFLMAEGRAVNKRTKSLTPVRTKKLLNSWRTKKVKLYKDGKVRVVRVQSTAPHAHLIELGHKIVSGGRTRERGRKLNRVQRSARGIKSGGYVQGDFMLEKSMSIQPKSNLVLVPEKGIFVFAEILIPELVNSLDDEKSLQDTFDQYCAGRLWEHNSYIKNVDKISNLCNVPF